MGLARDLVRTKAGYLVHRASCPDVAKLTEAGASFWLWAEGRELADVRLAMSMVGSRACIHCTPLEGE